MRYYVHDADGRVLRWYNIAPEDLALNVGADERVIDETYAGDVDRSNPGAGYVLNGVLVPRPAQSTVIDKETMTADGVDVVTLSNVPAEATFTATNRESGESVSGPISGAVMFSTVIPGAIAITIQCWPYLDWEVIVHAD
jgi:hypothetical protein